MKIVIIGDSHGNIANLKHVMGFAINIGACAVIHTGDWNNLKTVETVLEYKIPLYSCLGNADIDPEFEFKKLVEFEIYGVKIGVIHKLILPLSATQKGLDMIFTGHYHTQKEWEVDGVKIVRAGVLENRINFAIFDTKAKMVEFVNDD